MDLSKHVFERLKENLMDDKMASSESVARIIKHEILSAISDYVIVDHAESSIEFVFSASGMEINARIKTKGVKRIGAHVV